MRAFDWYQAVRRRKTLTKQTHILAYPLSNNISLIVRKRIRCAVAAGDRGTPTLLIAATGTPGQT